MGVMRVVVCGSRDWTDRETIRNRLAMLPDDTLVIEGENGKVSEDGTVTKGADLMARSVAEELGLEVEPVPAEWDQFGPAAGPIRNTRMLNMDPHLVIAFHDDLSESKGTVDTVEKARARDIPTEVIGSGEV